MKSWQELLNDYLNGTLSATDRADFERYIAENPERRAEFESWQAVREAVVEEAGSRVNHLPPLQLDRFDVSRNGYSEKGFQTMTSITLDRRTTSQRTAPRPSLTLAAAILAVIAVIALLIFNQRPDDQPPVAAPQPEETASPTAIPPTQTVMASATYTDDQKATISAEFGPTSTPTVHARWTQQPSIPGGTVTPSQIEPLVSAPATLIDRQQVLVGEVPKHVALSPDGQTLAVSAQSGVYLYNAADLSQQPHVLPVSDALSAAFNPDGTRIATLDFQANLQLWDQEYNSLVILGQSGLWGDLYFEDERIVSTLGTGIVIVDGNSLRTEPREATTTYLVSSPDGTINLAVRGDGTILTSDGKRYEIPATFIRQIVVDNARLLLADDGQIILVSLETGQVIETVDYGSGYVTGLAMSETHAAFTVNARSLHTLWVWNMESNQANPAMVYDIPLLDPVFTANDRFIVASDDGWLFTLSTD